jgi:hypothetical protein
MPKKEGFESWTTGEENAVKLIPIAKVCNTDPLLCIYLLCDLIHRSR